MTNAADHRFVESYFRQFDDQAGVLPPARCVQLREELQSHLRDAVAPDATDLEALDAIAQLGSPSTIIAQELDAPTPPLPLPAGAPGGQAPKSSRGLWIAFLVILVLIVALALTPLALSAIPTVSATHLVVLLLPPLVIAAGVLLIVARSRRRR
jgi:hypothetical protein